MIDEKEVTAYVTIPDCFLQGCSEDIVIFRADGGNHFTDYGIYEGMFLFFDRKKRFKKGRLSCYINTAGDDRPKYRVSDKNIDGYKHLGRLVLTLRNYEVSTNSFYLNWNYNDPELAVAGTILHGFEFLFVRLAPIVFLTSVVGVVVTYKKR